MTSITQQTLTGDSTDDFERERPDTFVHCDQCDAWLLRSERHAHQHDVPDYVGFSRSTAAEPEDPEDEPEVVGAWYTVELSYSVTYAFKVPAMSEQDATDIAKALKSDATPADSHHTWTDTRELEEITEDASDDVLDKLDSLERYP